MAKPLALTSGEPAGIGPDITIKAWLRRNELKLPAFYLLGDRDLLGDRADRLGLKVRLAAGAPVDACKAFHDAFHDMAAGHRASARPCHHDNIHAYDVFAYLPQAVGDVDG